MPRGPGRRGDPGHLWRPHQGLQLLLERGGAHRRAHLGRPEPGRDQVARAPACVEARSQPRRPHRFVQGHVARLDLYPFGDWVTLPDIAGHRDAQATSCPGDSCYVPASIYPKSGREARGRKDLRRVPRRRAHPVPPGHGLPPRFHRADGLVAPLVRQRGRLDHGEPSLAPGKAATITWDRTRQGAYVEPGWYRWRWPPRRPMAAPHAR